MLFRDFFCNKWLMTICALFFGTQWLEVLERTSFIKAPLKQYLPCLPECLFNQQLFLLFLRTSSGSAQFSKFRLSEGTALYWQFKSSSNFTRNKSLELVLQHNAEALSTLLLDFLILLCSFIYRESSELVDRRYYSRNTFKKFYCKCFKCCF